MKHPLPGLVLAASLFTQSASFAQSGMPDAPPSPQDTVSVQKGMATYRGYTAPTDEKALLDRLHLANQNEIKAGQLAQQRSQNPDVKAFGAIMMKAHTALDQKLTSYARSKGLKLAETPKPMNDAEEAAMAKSKATMEQLQVIRGAPFDSAYLASQVTGHDAVLGMVHTAQKALPKASPELAAMLDDLDKQVPAHRHQAWSMLGKLGDETGVGGSGPGHEPPPKP
ncbi:DUF4142 domain-containing protein [Corallococcus macrosporus]|uniref:DUF4142 domain-containing protein n=1 Tax=Corallococcus macrosporus DSM 14697 TaxID=1189310 RepID=A0A250K3N4_9BACT|nr:DUF4142 domain-containing protein [Corallococcus macrosporus]ATB50633.1 hypothetical protein MYMAC_006289 [Corallococcus macrosporus DSM 14697]